MTPEEKEKLEKMYSTIDPYYLKKHLECVENYIKMEESNIKMTNLVKETFSKDI